MRQIAWQLTEAPRPPAWWWIALAALCVLTAALALPQFVTSFDHWTGGDTGDRQTRW